MAYGDELRPSPRVQPRRTPVIKYTPLHVDHGVPGPGRYCPTNANKPRASAWVMGDRRARRSTVQSSGDSPGPAYMLPGSMTAQHTSMTPSSPRYGFGTQPRLAGATETTISPGPGAYSPRLTKQASPSTMMTVAAGQLTELTTPRTSTQRQKGVWSREAGRALAKPTAGPTAETYSPRIEYTRSRTPRYTMRAVGERQMCDPGGELSVGPLGYHPKTNRRGGTFGDAPSYSMANKNERSNAKRYFSPAHSRIYQGKESPSPATYTPLEQLGVTSYTISNTSTHAPLFTFGTEARPCAP